GLDAAKSEILDFEDVRVIAIQRFDRIKAQDGRLLRIPQEDFCQALSVPSTLKYNRDGGPGINECLSLLSGSDYAEEDRLSFLKAQIIFWLIAATDGHAKNFSIFLMPGGRFRMTPIYDVMTALPNCSGGTIRRKQVRLAMAVGKNRHYIGNEIMPRHFVQSAVAARISKEQVEDLLHKTEQNVPAALERSVRAMPDDFPEDIADSILQAAHAKTARMLASFPAKT
nr:HipA domain-containing protein [Gammaproteobacteria bacterium]